MEQNPSTTNKVFPIMAVLPVSKDTTLLTRMLWSQLPLPPVLCMVNKTSNRGREDVVRALPAPIVQLDDVDVIAVERMRATAEAVAIASNSVAQPLLRE